MKIKEHVYPSKLDFEKACERILGVEQAQANIHRHASTYVLGKEAIYTVFMDDKPLHSAEAIIIRKCFKHMDDTGFWPWIKLNENQT